MKHYDSFENIKFDGTLLGEEVWAFNKLDGQNFCAKYQPKLKAFTMYGSKTQNVDETSEQFGDAVRYFKKSMQDTLRGILINNSKKGDVFTGVDEITVFCEWSGENSFCGVHQEGDELKLTLIDVFLKKKGYIEPKYFWKLFNGYDDIAMPELIYQGKLTKDFINEINNNDWTKPDCKYPSVKEGVVCKRSTLMKGQRLPKVKVKTNWWLNKLKSTYPERWKELE